MLGNGGRTDMCCNCRFLTCSDQDIDMNRLVVSRRLGLAIRIVFQLTDRGGLYDNT